MEQENKEEKNPDGKRTLAYKVSILDILRRNNYNYWATQKETGVPQNTLRYWQHKHGPTIDEALSQDVAMAEVVVDSLVSMETELNKFTSHAVRTKMKALKKIDAMIAREKSTRNLIEVVKVLHLITNPEVDTNKLTPYEEVFTRFLIEGPKALPNGKKSIKSSDPGDTEE